MQLDPDNTKAFAAGAVLIGSSIVGNLPALGNTISAVAAGGYLIAVSYNGNIIPLWEQLKQEKGYLYFIGSVVVLGTLHSYAPVGKIADALLFISIISALVRFGANLDYNAIKTALTS